MSYPNRIVFGTADDLSGEFRFDDIQGPFQPKQIQPQILVRPGLDFERIRLTGSRGLPFPIRTCLNLADRDEAKQALSDYITLVDGNAYEVFQYDESWGFYYVLQVVEHSLSPVITAAGTLSQLGGLGSPVLPTVYQCCIWTLLSTQTPDPGP